MYYLKLICLVCLPMRAASAAEYFIDAGNGSDQADGISAATAWCSLERLNKTNFEPGDVIRLRAGEVFVGRFHSNDSGAEGKPIQFLSYGMGPKPQIAAQGRFQSAVLLENVSHWIVEDIEISNTGLQPLAKRFGLQITAHGGGVYGDIILRNLTVRDVNGSVSKKKGGGSAIRWEVSNKKAPTRLNGLLIENCHILRCDRDAIKGLMQPWDDLSNLSKNIIIRGNLLEDIGGDGIVPIGTEGALVEFNRIYGARRRIDNLHTCEGALFAGPSIGIWPWSSKNTHIRFNEVWGYAGTYDGQGLDSDFNCDGTLFEYNLSADNAGGFFLLCNWSKRQESGRSIGNTNTTIRHNVSFNDHLRSFVFSGPVSDAAVHGNVIYNTIEDQLQLIVDTPWEAGCFAESVRVTDNLFYTTGMAQIYQGTSDSSAVGLWKAQAPINRKSFEFRGNAYTRVEGFGGARHTEPEMKRLNKRETLRSLIGRFDAIPEVRDNFNMLHRFLESSRYWPIIEEHFKHSKN